MMYECDTVTCAAEVCENRQFGHAGRRNKDKISALPFQIVRTGNRGNGVRALRDFASGALIMEYTGEVITKSECLSRMQSQYKEAPVCLCIL